MRRADSVCFLCLWIAGGLIDLHNHVLLLNLEGHMHKNRWWPINLQPPRRSASVPARRISKFILLKNQFLFSLCGPQFWPGSAAVSSQQDYLTARKISQRRHKENQRSLLPLVTRRLDDRACSFTLTPRSTFLNTASSRGTKHRCHKHNYSLHQPRRVSTTGR